MPKRPDLPPEPWEADRYKVVDAQGNQIGSGCSESDPDAEVDFAIARILAAAPAALRVCQSLLDEGDYTQCGIRKYHEMRDAARAALAIAYPAEPKSLEKRLAESLVKCWGRLEAVACPEVKQVLMEARAAGLIE